MPTKFKWNLLNNTTNTSLGYPIKKSSTVFSDVSTEGEKSYSYTMKCGFATYVYSTSNYIANLDYTLNTNFYVPSDASLAKQAAEEAKAAANSAKTSADTASSRAQTTINQTVDAGTSAASWAHQSFDKANLASHDAGYIRML